MPYFCYPSKMFTGVSVVLRPIKKLFHRGEVDCHDVRELSSSYLENELTEGKRSAVQVHLSKCGPCQAFVDSLAATIGILAKLPLITAPSSFKQSIMARIKQDD